MNSEGARSSVIEMSEDIRFIKGVPSRIKRRFERYLAEKRVPKDEIRRLEIDKSDARVVGLTDEASVVLGKYLLDKLGNEYELPGPECVHFVAEEHFVKVAGKDSANSEGTADMTKAEILIKIYDSELDTLVNVVPTKPGRSQRARNESLDELLGARAELIKVLVHEYLHIIGFLRHKVKRKGNNFEYSERTGYSYDSYDGEEFFRSFNEALVEMMTIEATGSEYGSYPKDRELLDVIAFQVGRVAGKSIMPALKQGYFTGEMFHLRQIERLYGRGTLRMLAHVVPDDLDDDHIFKSLRIYFANPDMKNPDRLKLMDDIAKRTEAWRGTQAKKEEEG